MRPCPGLHRGERLKGLPPRPRAGPAQCACADPWGGGRSGTEEGLSPPGTSRCGFPGNHLQGDWARPPTFQVSARWPVGPPSPGTPFSWPGAHPACRSWGRTLTFCQDPRSLPGPRRRPSAADSGAPGAPWSRGSLGQRVPRPSAAEWGWGGRGPGALRLRGEWGGVTRRGRGGALPERGEGVSPWGTGWPLPRGVARSHENARAVEGGVSRQERGAGLLWGGGRSRVDRRRGAERGPPNSVLEGQAKAPPWRGVLRSVMATAWAGSLGTSGIHPGAHVH